MVEFFASSLVNGFMQSSMMGKGIVLIQLATSIVMVASVIGKWKSLASAAMMTRRIGRDVMGGREVLEYYTARHDSTHSAIENIYTAKQCMEEADGAKKEYTISDAVSMTVLDQKFYYETSSDENNHSVCVMFNQGTNHYLFTGDLEKEGEESLVELNELPHCQLFKGGHHGSKTSNTDTYYIWSYFA